MISKEFQGLVDSIVHIGKSHHGATLVERAKDNCVHVKKSIKDLPALTGEKKASCIIISAGPSVHKRQSIKRILDSGYSGTIIAADGAYVACLKVGLIPDFVVTMDPHATRVVRWFGDPDFEKHAAADDYYERQDLDIEFRKNTIEQNKQNIKLIDTHAAKTKAIVCTASHSKTVVSRLIDAGFDLHWWNPLVDDPRETGSLTRELYQINKVPCLNTGGTVGTAAWVFATDYLKIPNIAVTGMDFGYYIDTPIEKTQTYYELLAHLGVDADLSPYFVHYTFPLTGERFYTDATYYWYKENFIELIKKANSTTVNCSEGGTLIDPVVQCVALERFLLDFPTSREVQYG